MQTFTKDQFYSAIYAMRAYGTVVETIDVLVLTREQYKSLLMQNNIEFYREKDKSTSIHFMGTPVQVVEAYDLEMAVSANSYKGRRVGWWNCETNELEIKEVTSTLFRAYCKPKFGPRFRDMTGEHWNPFSFSHDYDAWFAYSATKHFHCGNHSQCLQEGMKHTKELEVYVGDNHWMAPNPFRQQKLESLDWGKR